MPTAYIYAGNWGHTHTITIQDEDGTVVDLSSAATRSILFRDPSGNVATKTGALVSDGTDGKIEYTVTDGDVVDDEAGGWRRQAQVVFSDGSYYTTDEEYTVHQALS